MTFGLDQQTNMISPLDPGSSVEVTYTEVNGKNMARTVVNPAVLLQIDHPTDRIHLMPLVLMAAIVVAIAVVLQQLPRETPAGMTSTTRYGENSRAAAGFTFATAGLRSAKRLRSTNQQFAGRSARRRMK